MDDTRDELMSHAEHWGYDFDSRCLECAEVRAGAALAAALMDANYPGDSGEDVDRLIAALHDRGYGLVRLADTGEEAAR